MISGDISSLILTGDPDYTIIPVDINLITRYEFYINAQVYGRTDPVLSNKLKTLIVGCPNGIGIPIIDSDQQDYSTLVATMLLPGFGWTGIDFWSFIAPNIADTRFECEVIEIEIIEILENDIDITILQPNAVTISGPDETTIETTDYLISVDIAKC